MEPLVKRAKDEKTGVALNVYQDDLGMDSPRDWDNLGTMVCFHRDYNLGDEHSYETPRDFLENLAAELITDTELRYACLKAVENWEEELDEEEKDDLFDDLVDNGFIEEATDEELWEIITDHAVILPLYLYDHSGITMKTKPFGCPWDSGQVGWIYVTHDRISKELTSDEEKADWQKAEDILNQEIKTYDQYITGEVFGFVLEKEDVCDNCKQQVQEHIDSLWGLYGYEDLEENLKIHLEEEYHYLIDQLETVL